MDFTQYRSQDLHNRLLISGLTPLDVLVVGATGVGKSSTLNSLFNCNVARVGYGVDPQTSCIESYRLGDALRLWDSPGFGDGTEHDKKYKKALKKILKETVDVENREYGLIDLVLVILDSSSRDLSTAYEVIRKILKRIEPERVLVVLNQADFSMKGRNWDEASNKPEPALLQHLKAQAESVRNRIYESTGLKIALPVYYSAQFNYNVEAVYDLIIDNIPMKHREIHNNNLSGFSFNFL